MKRGGIPLDPLSAAVLSVMVSAPLLALESSSTNAVHGHQITITGTPVIQRGAGPLIRVTNLPNAQDEDSTDTHVGWRYVWQVAGSDVAAEAVSPSADAVPEFSARQQDYDYPVRVCLKAVASSGYPVATQTSEQVCSGEMMLIDSAPTASNVIISGTPILGQTLAGSYTYVDAEGDVEDVTTYQWYRADNAAGTSNKVAISGATGKTYTVQSADSNKYLIFEVTPGAATGKPTLGMPASSESALVTTLLSIFSTPDRVLRTWPEANAYCSSLTLNGYSNWRLPMSSELLSLYDENPNDTLHTSHDWANNSLYWSSTPKNNGFHEAVYLANGDVYISSDLNVDYVTCVH